MRFDPSIESPFDFLGEGNRSCLPEATCVLYEQLESKLRQSAVAGFEADVLRSSPLANTLRSEAENLARAEQLAQALEVLVKARFLPQRPPAGQALIPALEARQKLYAGTLSFEAFCGQVREALLELRSEYSYLLMPLKRLTVRLRQAGEEAGCDPFVRAVRQVAPESVLWQGYTQARQDLEERVRSAVTLLREVPPDTLEDVLAHVAAVIKAVELSFVAAGQFVDPVPRLPMGDFRPLESEDNQLDRLNRAYYRLRGAEIYEDFVTAVSHDSLQARADAHAFRNDLRRLQAHDGPVHVLEVGVGGGQYAADFLQECQKIGGEWSPLPFYRRLTYVMGDISPAMLRDALGSQKTDNVQVVGLDELSTYAPYHLQRYNELFDDLPACSVLYNDPQGKLYRAELRGTFPEGMLPEGVTLEELAAWMDAADLERLTPVGVETLALIDWDVRFVPCVLAEFPGGELLKAEELPRDRLIPLNGGGVQFLRGALERSGLGAIRLFDYGLGDFEQCAGTYTAANQIVRRYGASATRDVLFPLLQRVAEQSGRQARIQRLEEFIAESMGEAPSAFRFLMGIEGGNLVSRVASGAEAPFPLTALKHYSEIAAHPGQDYSRWLAELREKGWLDLCQPEGAQAGTNLERLAIDLDFAVNSAFRRCCEGLLREDAAWLVGAAMKAEVKSALERIGYASEAIDRQLAHPTSGKFWVLSVS